MIRMKSLWKGNLALRLIMLIWCLYAMFFIYQSSFVINGNRYFVLFDDAMISMTYARNLANGYGLVWNSGERVEGYTNLLWTLFMTIPHLLPIPERLTSLTIQVSSLMLLLLVFFFTYRIGLLITNGSQFVALAAVLFTAFYYPLNYWSLMGMEVGVLALFLIATVYLLLRYLRDREVKCAYLAYFLLAISTLIRMDMSLLTIVLVGYMGLTDSELRWKHFIIGFGLLFLVLSGQTLWRFWYYGDIVPNTYYLKLVGYPIGLRIIRGLIVTLRFVWDCNWILFLSPFVAVIFIPNKTIRLFAVAFGTQMLYSIYVGGDAWEGFGGANRYVSVVMPVFFLLFTWSLKQVYLFLSQALQIRTVRLKWIIGAILFACLVNFNASRELRALKNWMLVSAPYKVDSMEQKVRLALLIREITYPQAKCAVVWAGAIPYFSHRRSIDLLGKCDKKVAQEPMRTPFKASRLTGFYPGHMKWNYSYSIGELKPDIVAQIWSNPEEAQPYLLKYYQAISLTGQLEGYTIYLRKGSKNIVWEKVKDLTKIKVVAEK